jgi:hypothetical protein
LRDRIRIRLIVSSDGAWSDEDGNFASSGAAQVDDITVSWSDGSSFEDFEGELPFAWSNARRPFAGEFSKVFAQAQDLDPCRTTNSPLMTFIDDGSPVGNSEEALRTFGFDSTGGTTSLNWAYGIQGGWVVNYNGGLSLGLVSLSNSVWSPPIEWDLPGPEDDGPEFVGAFLRFSAWAHLPLLNGIYYTWQVRASTDGMLTWGPWEDYTFVWQNPNPVWENRQFEIGPLLPDNPTHVQLSFGVDDLSDLIEFPDYDATPAPWFDNIALAKYALSGPAITARDIDLAQSGFPPLGSIDASTPAARDLLDVRFDMARDINTRGLGIIPGDSIIADVEAIIPGTTLADVRMRWVLDRNPLFDDVRSPPSRPEDVLVDTEFAPNRWYGEVLGQPSTSGGVPLANRFFFDLPDADFLHPGDILRYVLQATDSGGRITTLPAHVTGLEDGTGFDRRFTVRGLPSLRNEGGTQPSILVINDAFNRGFDEELGGAHAQIGLREGLDFDQFDVLGPTSGVSNGIGSAGGHGANADQLAGYSTIIYHAADLSIRLLSDGSNDGLNDKSNDLSVLTVWRNLTGNRHGAFFGDSFASTVNSESASGASFVQDVLRVQVEGEDVSDLIGGAQVPLVGPVNPLYVTTIAAYGSCPRIARFDNLRPLSPAERSHAWLGPNLVPVPGVAAGIRLIDSDPFGARKTMLTIPIAFDRIGNRLQRAPMQPPARALFLQEILADFGLGNGGLPSSASPPTLDALGLRAAPNPFNPRTVIQLQLDASQRLRLSILNVRGELVRRLHDGQLAAGAHPFVWDGTDRRGEAVASGVYIAVAEAEGGPTERLKLALLR